MTGVWVSHDTRDQIVDFVRRWSEKTGIAAGRFIGWLDGAASKFYDWRESYGKVNEHNGRVPRGQAGLLSKGNGKPSKKGTGFEQPLAARQHWHIDVSYINISGTCAAFWMAVAAASLTGICGSR